jgi:hypothetical protein
MKTQNKVWTALSIYVVFIAVIAIMLSSCGSSKYHPCDAYKTQYKPLKADQHKRHHHKCDAFN